MEIKTNAGTVEIIPIQTGTVVVKRRFRDGRVQGFLSKPDFLLDKKFTEPLPIWAWVVKHPEGIFIIDTGENSRVNNKDYFDKSNFLTRWINHTQFKFEVSPEQEIGRQLNKMGITKDKIKQVVLTHLHIDHFDGLNDFEGVDILVNKYEWEHQNYFVPTLYPDWFKPNLVKTGQDVAGKFKGTYLTPTNDLSLIQTPGHTAGHCSVLLEGTDFSVIIAGDVVYNQEQLKNNRFAGVNENFNTAKTTYRLLTDYEKATNNISTKPRPVFSRKVKQP